MTATVVLVLVVCATWTLGLAQDALNWTCDFPLEQTTNLTWVNGSWHKRAVVGNIIYQGELGCNTLDIEMENETSLVFQYHESELQTDTVLKVNSSNKSFWILGNNLMKITDLLNDKSTLAITECTFEQRIVVYTRNYTMDLKEVTDKLKAEDVSGIWYMDPNQKNCPVNGAPTIKTFTQFGLLVTMVLLRVL